MKAYPKDNQFNSEFVHSPHFRLNTSPSRSPSISPISVFPPHEYFCFWLWQSSGQVLLPQVVIILTCNTLAFLCGTQLEHMLPRVFVKIMPLLAFHLCPASLTLLPISAGSRFLICCLTNTQVFVSRLASEEPNLGWQSSYSGELWKTPSFKRTVFVCISSRMENLEWNAELGIP